MIRVVLNYPRIITLERTGDQRSDHAATPGGTRIIAHEVSSTRLPRHAVIQFFVVGFLFCSLLGLFFFLGGGGGGGGGGQGQDKIEVWQIKLNFVLTI